MGKALFVVDVHDVWAKRNPETTRKILDAVNEMRQQMDIVWIYAASSVELPLTEFQPNTLREKFNLLNERYNLVVQPHLGDLVATKPSMNGYQNTDLADRLRERGITEHYYLGFVGTECVLSTALGGAKAGFDSNLVCDLTAEGRDQCFDFEQLPAEVKQQVKLTNSKALKR